MVVKPNSARLIMSTKDTTAGGRKGRPAWNACVVTAAPSRPMLYVPVSTSARPVMEQMIMESMKVCVMDTRPWRAGSFV